MVRDADDRLVAPEKDHVDRKAHEEHLDRRRAVISIPWPGSSRSRPMRPRIGRACSLRLRNTYNLVPGGVDDADYWRQRSLAARPASHLVCLRVIHRGQGHHRVSLSGATCDTASAERMAPALPTMDAGLAALSNVGFTSSHDHEPRASSHRDSISNRKRSAPADRGAATSRCRPCIRCFAASFDLASQSCRSRQCRMGFNGGRGPADALRRRRQRVHLALDLAQTRSNDAQTVGSRVFPGATRQIHSGELLAVRGRVALARAYLVPIRPLAVSLPVELAGSVAAARSFRCCCSGVGGSWAQRSSLPFCTSSEVGCGAADCEARGRRHGPRSARGSLGGRERSAVLCGYLGSRSGAVSGSSRARC